MTVHGEIRMVAGFPDLYYAVVKENETKTLFISTRRYKLKEDAHRVLWCLGLIDIRDRVPPDVPAREQPGLEE